MVRTAAILTLIMLFAALPVWPAGAVSLDITSVGSGTWDATAWPNTQRSGTITVTSGSSTVIGTGTAFTAELSAGNIIKTNDVPPVPIGVVASIVSDTQLTLTTNSPTTWTGIDYLVQGVGPADNATIDSSHTVTIAANAVNQTGTVTVNTGGTLVVSNPGTVFNILTVNGTVSATNNVAFGELTVNSGGIVNAAGSGAYTASSLTINSGGAMNILRNFIVDSATTIAGTINFSSTDATGRDVIFLGPVTLETGATWNESTSGNGSNNSYDFFSDFTNNATVFVTSDNSTHSFGGTGKTLDGSTNTSIARLNIDGTYTNNGILTVGINLSGTGTLTNSTTGTLNAESEVSIHTLANAGTMNKTGAGTISIPITDFTNTGTLNINGTGPIMGITNNAGGTVNLASAGIMEAFNNATATSVLNISALGAPPEITTLMVTAPGNTVNYNGAGDQTVKPVTYYNLILSGSGNKSISMTDGSTLANGDLSIAPTGTAKAAITGIDLGVNSLTLGGFGKVNGTWGSSGSAAEFQNDTYFALGTGYLNVATDTRLDQTINFTSTPPSNAVVGGPTYTPTATATSGLDVTFTIDATATSVCSISAGVVSFDSAGTCVINADQAGNENYKPAVQVQQSFTVNLPLFARIFIADEEVQDSPFGLVAGESIRRSFPGIDDGPVKIEGNVDLVAAERVIYEVNGLPTSFSEMMGLPDGLLDTTYWLPWYNNVGLNTQLRIANVSNATATVQVFIGDEEVDGSPFLLDVGESIRRSFPGIDDGPVQIVSDVPVVAASRVIYTVNGLQTSFSEIMALPASQLDTTYWLPWYNNLGLDSQLRFANVGNATATVHVFIGDEEVDGSPFILDVGESTRQSFPGIDDGPVRIESDVPIVAAERVVYKVNGSFTSYTEMMALPDGQLDTTFWFPWYNNLGLDSQLRFANVSNAVATVHIFIGGEEVQGSPFTLQPGESVRQSFPGIDDGPVRIESDVPIVAAERVIYKVGSIPTSFSEMMGLPNLLLDTIYWFPWYNNLGLHTQLRFGMP